MESAPPRVSVVIPNRNGVAAPSGLRYLDMVLASLGEQSFRDFDVTVVDNGSTDESVEYLGERWPDVQVVATGENAGFPIAVNRGVAATRGEYVALLNNDLELSRDWLELLVTELDDDPALGFATGKVLRYDDRGILEQAGLELYSCGLFVPRGLDDPDTGQFGERREIAAATGAAVLYRRQALERIDGFDEDYFLYCEDVDVCVRMRLAGYRGLYVPAPEAYHVRGGTTGTASELTRFYITRNTLITLLNDLPRPLLARSAAKIALFHVDRLREAMRQGEAATMVRAYLSFLRTLPRTLAKRRRALRKRAPLEEVASAWNEEYPLETRFGRLSR